MPRSVESNDSGWPTGPDKKGWRHFGDGFAGELVAARIQGYDSSTLGYVDVAVDSDGNLKLAAEVSVAIGTVGQGAAGSQAWKVTDAALTDGSLRVGGSVAVTGHVTVDNASIAITAAALPLPTGAALDATLTGGALQAQGNVASGSADIGNPLKVGGRYNATPPTLTDGQRGDFQLDTRGSQKVALVGVNNSNGPIVSGPSSDANAAQIGLYTLPQPFVFNGTTWDRMRGDSLAGLWVQSKAEVATAADATGSLPPVLKIVGGYDGTYARSFSVRQTDGVNMLHTRDRETRQELEHIHLLMVEQTDLLRQLVGERADLI